MSTLYATVAVYDDAEAAEKDWSALESAAETSQVDIADAAFLTSHDGEATVLQRRSRHGWGKGAVAGAVIGVLFPPALVGATAVGAGGGALVARMTRSLGRSKVKDLGETLDSGALAIVVEPAEASEQVAGTLKAAKTIKTAPSASTEEIQQVLSSS